MKKVLLAVCLIASASANAHSFWPDSYAVMKAPGKVTTIFTHLRSKEDGYFTFTLNDKKLGDKQLIFAGDVADFPIDVPNSMIKNNVVEICSTQSAKKDTLEKMVCLKIQIS